MKTLSEVFRKIGTVDERITLLNLAQTAGVGADSIDIDAIDEYIKSGNEVIVYLNDAGVEIDAEHKKEAKYVWVSTGLHRGGHPIFVAFCRSYGVFKAYKTGTYSYLVEKLMEFKADKLVEKQNAIDLLEDIYEMLLMKEYWKRPNEFSPYAPLSDLLFIQQQKLENELNQGIRKNYILNQANTKLFYNTGLIDYYGNDIYLIMDIDKHTKRLGNPKVFRSKNDMAASGFALEDRIKKIRPIIYYNDVNQLIFKADSLEEINYDDHRRLKHLLEERNCRLPEEVRSLSLDVLCQKLKSALEFNINMSKRDYKYILPMYNAKFDNIQFLMPFHINNSVNDVPEIVIVLSRNENAQFYEIMTILSVEDAYFNARAISIPSCSWIGTPDKQ